LYEAFDESIDWSHCFPMRRTQAIKIGVRTAVAVAAVYALLFNALLSAAAPFVPSPSADTIICIHDGGGSDQQTPTAPAHDNLCCVAVCGAAIAALPPADYSQIRLYPPAVFIPAKWSVALIAPSPLPNFQASPRGPPSLL
jgi:hypothetical protein